MTTVNDPKGEAGSKKAPMWLLPPVALEQTAWVAKLGAEKYGPFNWRKTGVCATTYVSAIMRHLNAWRDGEDLDPESGISHIAHIATSCNILMDAAACGTLQDDRNKRPEAGISGLGFRVYPDVEIGLEAYLDAADRELLRTASEDSPYAEQLRRVFAPVAETGVEATLGAMTTTGLEDETFGPCPWTGLIDKTADFTGDIEAIEAIEAIEDDDCQKATIAPLPSAHVKVVDHDLKVGDAAFVVPLHAHSFTTKIMNIVDIRGEKVYTFANGYKYTESGLYTITHA